MVAVIVIVCHCSHFSLVLNFISKRQTNTNLNCRQSNGDIATGLHFILIRCSIFSTAFWISRIVEERKKKTIYATQQQFLFCMKNANVAYSLQTKQHHLNGCHFAAVIVLLVVCTSCLSVCDVRICIVYLFINKNFIGSNWRCIVSSDTSIAVFVHLLHVFTRHSKWLNSFRSLCMCVCCFLFSVRFWFRSSYQNTV